MCPRRRQGGRIREIVWIVWIVMIARRALIGAIALTAWILQRRNRRECANPADCLDRVDRVGVVDRRSNFSERETCVNPFDGRNGGKLRNSSAKIRILQDRNSKGPPRVK